MSRRTFKWNLLHATNATICRFTCKTTYVCLGGGGVSDGREMPNFCFGTLIFQLAWRIILGPTTCFTVGVKLFEYISSYETTLKASLKSLNWPFYVGYFGEL